MPSAFQLMPSLEGDEMAFVHELIKDMDESHAQQFAIAYMSRRKDPNNMLLFAIIGFLGIAGIQRFVINEVGMGILYFLTCGLCFIGTIIDVVNHKKLAFEYNSKRAQEVAALLKAYS